MRKLLLLICALLTGVSGAWADGTVTIGASSDIQSKSTFYYSNGSIAPWGNWCQKAVFGAVTLEGTISNTSGYFRVDGAPHTITISVPSSMKITAYSFDLKQLDGTGCTANGTELNNSSYTTVSGSSLNTNSVTITFANTPGSGECRILVLNFTVTYTGSMTPADLNTSKCYNIRNNRGTWAVSGSDATEVNSTSELYLDYSSSDAKQQFAFVEVFGKYYLYSVAAQKFAYVSGTKLALTDKFDYNVQHSPVTFTASTSSTYKDYSPVIITVGGQQFGVSTGFSPDVYKYNDATDGGNAAWLVEAGSFDSSTASTQIVNSRTTLFELSTDQAPKYYAWRTAVGNAPSYIYTDNGNPANPNNHSITKTNPIDAKYAWAFIGDYDNGCLIKNKATGTYLGGRTASGGYMAMETTANSYFYPLYNGESKNVWYCLTYDYYIDRAGGAPYAHTSGNNNDYIRLYEVTFSLSNASAGLKVGTETISDFSTPILITAEAALTCADEDYGIKTYDGYSTLAEALTNDADGVINIVVEEKKSITYNLTWGGTAISSKTSVQKQFVGEAVAAAATVFGTAPAYCSYGTPDVATIEASTTTVNVALNWAGPFDISSDYASAVWYYVNIGGAWTMDDGTNIVAADSRITAIEAGDGALWAFVGDPTSLMMYNKGRGSEYKLNVGNHLTMATSVKYAPLTITRIDATTFYLANDGDYYLGYDATATDSKYPYVSPADSRAEMSVISYYCGQALKNWADYVGDSAGKLFGVRSASVTSMESMILGFPNMTESDYNNYFATIPNSTIEGYIIYEYPASTGYYRIKNNSTGNYLAYGRAATSSSTYNPGLIAVSDANDFSTIIRLNQKTVANQQKIQRTYSISTQGLNVQLQGDANQPFPATDAEAKEFVFNIANPAGVVSITNTASRVDDNNDGSLHEASDGWTVHGVVNWSASAGASKWVVEEAETVNVSLNGPVGGYYYATLCLPFDVTLSEACAYTLTLNNTKDALTLSDATDEVPAGTPVLLRASAATITATIGSGYAATPSTGTSLTGCYASATVDAETVYTLSNGDYGIGFYKFTGTSIAPNRAYVSAEAAALAARGLVLLFGETTGINGIAPTVPAGETFDLQGRRVNQAAKGLYIQGSKKVLF